MLFSGCSPRPRKVNETSVKTKEILRTLVPNEYAEATKLSSVNHNEAVSALSEEQERAIGMRAISIAYLLAALGDNYEDNRDKVTSAIADCRSGIITDSCDLIVGYGIDLFNRGDKSFLKTLLDVGIGSDGALSESLGDFYANVLWKQPDLFLQGVSGYPNNQQAELARLAGAADGFGMGDDMLRDVRNSLQQLSAQKNPLAPVAKTCLDGVNKGDKLAKTNQSSDN